VDSWLARLRPADWSSCLPGLFLPRVFKVGHQPLVVSRGPASLCLEPGLGLHKLILPRKLQHSKRLL
jgi:hypothetical protein